MPDGSLIILATIFLVFLLIIRLRNPRFLYQFIRLTRISDQLFQPSKPKRNQYIADLLNENLVYIGGFLIGWGNILWFLWASSRHDWLMILWLVINILCLAIIWAISLATIAFTLIGILWFGWIILVSIVLSFFYWPHGSQEL